MGRLTQRFSGGTAKQNVIEHPYFLKAISMNPFVGTTHDGNSHEYHKGFLVKPMPFLYRFRHNIFPQGKATGYFSHNPGGKSVHWLEVSTIEKMRVQIFGEEAVPMFTLSIIVFLFTAYQLYRMAYLHPQITWYKIALWTTKPWVSQVRTSKKHQMDQPVYRFFHRTPEWYTFDIYRELLRGGVIANDPYLEHIRHIGREDELYMQANDRQWGEGNRGKILPKPLPRSGEKSGHVVPMVVTH